jgi:beta-lactam-binding protein with PASTA domain
MLLGLGLMAGCGSGSSGAPPIPADQPSHTASVDMPTPHLHGLTVAQARAALRQLGLVLGPVRYRLARSASKGIVIHQVPPVGILLRNGAVVTVVVSK